MNFILKNENAIYYECGFSCDNSIFLKFGNEAFFVTDGRYVTEAKENIKSAEVINSDFDIYKTSRQILRKNKIKKVIYDPLDWSVANFEKLSSNLNCYFFSKQNFSQKKRIIKDEIEIEKIKKAVSLGREGFENFAKYLRLNGNGKSEKKLFFKANEILCQYGELTPSFDPIIAIDKNAAKPHSLPTDTKLQEDALLLLDAGIKYQRYCSDRTRVIEYSAGKELNFSKKQNFKDKKQQKIYDIVLKAQEKAIKYAKVGTKAKDIDKAARDVIEKAGYGKYYIHSTGHGVGLDIHELPVISKRSETVIEENMIFTIEPGIYLPNEFGVRIEDMLIMSKNGAQIL